MNLKRGHLFVLTVLFGLLSGMAWQFELPLLLFFSFVPLLLVENHFISSESKRPRLALFGYAYLAFFIWNIVATWWVAYASIGGAAMAILCNSLLMTGVFMFYFSTKRRLKKSWGVWLIIPFWLAWEYLHQHWDLTWTWLNLGNAFAFNTSIIQWYEFTGVAGGTTWILVVNILLFKLIINRSELKKKLAIIASVLILPILLSLLVSKPASLITTQNSKSVVIVQPNWDAYTQKFDVPFEEQFDTLLRQINGQVDSTTDYLVLPETYITAQYSNDIIDEGNYQENAHLQLFKQKILAKFPNLTVITGGNSDYYYAPNEKLSATARKYEGGYYDTYNTAFQIDSSKNIEFYHKSKLVPGVELMPFPWFFKMFEDFIIEIGGTTGSLGVQEDREVFTSLHGTKVAPVVCYESVYGEYVGEYVKKGADFIFIVTNDDWWENTPGHKQHLAFAKLRAIETRKPIARTANTGVSAVIDIDGTIKESLAFETRGIIKTNLVKNDIKTFYTICGDYLAKLSLVILLLLYPFSFWIKRKRAKVN